MPNYFCKWIVIILACGVTVPGCTFIDGTKVSEAYNPFTSVRMQTVQYKEVKFSVLFCQVS